RRIILVSLLRFYLCVSVDLGSIMVIFFFSSRRRHTRFSRDWSSDVCSSDLGSLTIRPSSAITVASVICSPSASHSDQSHAQSRTLSGSRSPYIDRPLCSMYCQCPAFGTHRIDAGVCNDDQSPLWIRLPPRLVAPTGDENHTGGGTGTCQRRASRPVAGHHRVRYRQSGARCCPPTCPGAEPCRQRRDHTRP